MSKYFHVLRYYSLQQEKVFNKIPSSSSTIFSPSSKKFAVGNLTSQLIKGKDCKINLKMREGNSLLQF